MLLKMLILDPGFQAEVGRTAHGRDYHIMAERELGTLGLHLVICHLLNHAAVDAFACTVPKAFKISNTATDYKLQSKVLQMPKIESPNRASARYVTLCCLAVLISSVATSALVGTWIYIVMRDQMVTWADMSGRAMASLDHQRGITNLCAVGSESNIRIEHLVGSQEFTKLRYWKVSSRMDERFVTSYNIRMREENEPSVTR